MTAAPEASQRQAPPLSVDQEALWYHSRLAPTQLTYNETISIRKDGPLDVPALRRAFEEVVRRHEAWRTGFEVVGGQPVQVVRPAPRFELPVSDLSHLSPEGAERQAVRRVAEVSRIPYDLARGPLVRPRLFRFPDEHHRLYLAMHHLVFDGVSVTRVILPELVAIYDAFRAGQPSPLPEPPTRYADYARWEQRWIAEPRAERRLGYWRERLTPLPAPSLPLDQPRPSEPRLGGGAVPLALPRESVERLRAAGQSTGATLFQVLATCWSLLLGRYSGQSEVVFSTAADMRQRPELQLLVGCCLTPLVLRVDLGGEVPVTELIVRVRNELLDGLDQLVPFERVVRGLPPAEGSGANPVYQTMLVLEPATEAPDPDWSLHQIDSVLANAVGSVKLDLELQLDERPDGHLSGQLIYNRDLFEPASVERMVGHWLGICAAVADDPTAPASRIPTLTAAERQRQLVEWNATAVELPPDPVHELVRERALAQPEAIAVADGAGALSYAEAERRASAVAARLLAAGVRPGDVVALLAEPSAELVVGALGALKAGAAHLLLDPDLPAARLRQMVGDAAPAAILARPELADVLEAPAGKMLPLTEAGDGDGEQVGTAPAAPPGDAACCVQYTSCLTGEPSGVVIGHAATVNLATALAAGLGLSAADRVLALGPNLFRTAAVELWLPLIAGATIVLAPVAAAADGGAVSRLVKAERITFLHTSPSTWQALIDTGLRASRSLRALSGGELLSEALAGQILDRCRVLWNAYGAAQTGGYRTLARVERSAPPTLGRPLANTRVYVLDADGQPAPVGVDGELVVGGDGLASGYLNRPQPGAEAFVEDPLGPGTAYRTGDLAHWLPDGRLQLRAAR